MIRHVWSVVCASSIIDAQTNNISLINVLEQLNLAAAPPTTPTPIPVPLQLVSLWARDENSTAESATARIRLRTPGGLEDEIGQFAVDLSHYARYRSRMMITHLLVDRAGYYEFMVERQSGEGWAEVARVPLQLVIGPPPTMN